MFSAFIWSPTETSAVLSEMLRNESCVTQESNLSGLIIVTPRKDEGKERQKKERRDIRESSTVHHVLLGLLVTLLLVLEVKPMSSSMKASTLHTDMSFDSQSRHFYISLSN